MTKTVLARDGRKLAVEEWGAPDGVGVFLMHGTPGSRFGPRPRESVLYRLGVRLIAYDRPGYGESDRLGERVVAHAAEDVAAIADALGMERFSVLGRSGGGPHALACACLLGDRIRCAAVLVGLAPRDADGLDWYDGMTASNVSAYQTAEVGSRVLAARFEAQAALIRRDPAAHLPYRDRELSASDQRVMADSGIRTMMVSNFAEAVKRNGGGWVDDAVSFITAWGFDPGRIGVPVLLWHAARDVHAPVRHTLWLADRIPGSHLVIAADAAHFSALSMVPWALSWLVDRRRP
ncbi:MAG: alpha/beta fold hydrolase [Catenulispora sp.]